MQFWTGLWKLWGFFMILWLSWDWQVVMRLLDLCHDNSNMSAAGSWHRTFHSIMLNSFETCFCWASWSRINKCVNPLIQGDEIFTFLLQVNHRWCHTTSIGGMHLISNFHAFKTTAVWPPQWGTPCWVSSPPYRMKYVLSCIEKVSPSLKYWFPHAPAPLALKPFDDSRNRWATCHCETRWHGKAR